MTSNFLIQAVMATLCYFDIGYLANMKRENKALANRIQVLNQRTGFYQKHNESVSATGSGIAYYHRFA